ncbi:MAG: shikimate kinase [Chlamydiota bacterium]
MNLILFGFKGVGKTHFGKLLAHQIHRPFIDTDALIENLFAKKKTPREIHQILGEKEFRALENEALQTLKGVQNSIIATGGGTFLNPESADFLQKIGALVYLKASVGTLRKRILQGELPSFLDKNDLEGSFLKMIHEREPIYRSLPARTVDVDVLDEAGVLAALTSILLLEEPPNGF